MAPSGGSTLTTNTNKERALAKLMLPDAPDSGIKLNVEGSSFR